MPQTKSAVQRVRLAEKQRIANKGKKVDLRKMLKSFDPNAEGAAASLKKIQSKLDKLARTGVVTKNFASNHKSKLARQIAKPKA
jgi:small subunit ribosomal protein S20